MSYTISQIAALKNAAEAGIVEAAVNQFPFLAGLSAKEIKDTEYKVPVRTANAVGAWRAENTAGTATGPTFVQRIATMKDYDLSWFVDNQVVRSSSEPVDVVLAGIVAGVYAGAMEGIEKQIVSGDSTASGFDGLIKTAVSASRVVSAGTGSAGATGHVVLVNTKEIEVLLGQQASLFNEAEIDYVRDGSGIWGYAQNREGFVGANLTNHKAVALLKNVTADTSDVEGKILETIYSFAGTYDAILLPRYVCGMIQKERSAASTTGATSPRVTDVNGITVVVLDTMTLSGNAL